MFRKGLDTFESPNYCNHLNSPSHTPKISQEPHSVRKSVLSHLTLPQRPEEHVQNSPVFPEVGVASPCRRELPGSGHAGEHWQNSLLLLNGNLPSMSALPPDKN